ncbi:MAG: energy-coupling factor transporter transmembrane protein EcfT [Lachnospiraceae bacterium]|nr:energy-coupling factor transporter transmembrane protein EcfT [Lachnospiraceae bacterium]MBO7362937.1 energy-coupling factor transporter transmembrane protein EcfT [Lachnospiraceae bacterium]MBP5252426.1 energy-coupling factor transporter transmembrane protein EcfT [Lachnospiraceae bacterium]MBP5472365.1 energy-coupling factor transporter transmembrane protein EcfT [Lachnospiraceae bacterium]
MIRDITIGQYYQTDSTVHRLDPRVKLLGTLLFIVALFLYKNPAGYALGLVFLLSVIKLSHVPLKFITKGLKGIMIVLVFTVLINLFLTPGTAVVSFWKLTITYEGIGVALTMLFRLTMLIMGSSIVTLTTTPNNLTDGLEKGLGFLKIFRVPVGDVAMMMSIALRFIPILMEETDRIMKAQLARGADFESGNIVKKAKALVPVLVPLFVSAFRRAGDLAMAMEARCYRGGDGRTKMKPLIYKKRDAMAYIILFSFVVISVWIGRWSVISGFFNSIYSSFIPK